MKCPSCDAELTGKHCGCGYAYVPTGAARVERVERVQQASEAVRAEPSFAIPQVRREVIEKEAEVRLFIAQYQKDNPSATRMQACAAYLRAHSPKGAEMLRTMTGR